MKLAIITILLAASIVIGGILIAAYFEDIKGFILPQWSYLPIGLSLFFGPIIYLVRDAILVANAIHKYNKSVEENERGY